MAEEWRPIIGYAEHYDVSDRGSIRSRRFSKVKPIRQRLDKNGYHMVNLCDDRGAATKKVHRLVLEAFVGPCPDGMLACHNDGVKAHNSASNLRWDTPTSNMLDVARHGAGNGSKTHCTRGHIYDESNTYLWRGSRHCKACQKLRGARFYLESLNRKAVA